MYLTEIKIMEKLKVDNSFSAIDFDQLRNTWRELE